MAAFRRTPVYPVRPKLQIAPFLGGFSIAYRYRAKIVCETWAEWKSAISTARFMQWIIY